MAYYALIMAGGVGTRLWPLSRRERPKQSLRLIGDRTMFEHAIDRLVSLFNPEEILVVTDARHVDELAAQGKEVTTIFQRGEGDKDLRPAAARTQFVEKWLVPVFTLLWAGGIIALAAVEARHLGAYRADALSGLEEVGKGILLLLVAGFAAFLFSRYTTGMGKSPQWRLLRAPGSYLLLLALTTPARLTVGRLGIFDFPAGRYAYAGSARGSGGLRARVARHLRAEKRLHWHIDYLAARAPIVEVWYTESSARLECRWAARLSALPGANIPVDGFGSSDCRCPSHLIQLADGVNSEILGHPHIGKLKIR